MRTNIIKMKLSREFKTVAEKLAFQQFNTTAFDWFIFFALAVCYTGIFYPGLMSPDSNAMYSTALNHHYADHQPPLMPFLWHYLLYIKDGPALMHITNMVLLWASVYILVFKIFKNSKLKYYAMFIPFIPQVLVYSGWIWKDVTFTYGYGMLSMYLAYAMIFKKEITTFRKVMFFVALFYFTSVKYQAQFVAPIMVAWYFSVQNNNKFNFKIFIKSIFVTIILLCGIYGVNDLLVTKRGSGSSNSWQYVKIFDLSGMSVFSGKVMVPSFMLKNSNITVKDIENKYDFLWEPLIAEPDSPLVLPTDEKQRQILLDTWWNAVLSDPASYLHHRADRWVKGLFLTSPGKMFLEKKLASKPSISKYILPLANLMAFIFIVPFIFVSIYLAVKSQVPGVKFYARSVLYLIAMGLTLLAILFVKSLCCDPRYIYFTVYLFMLSTPFSLYCINSRNHSLWRKASS